MAGKYTIDLSDGGLGLFDVALNVMEATGEKFSAVLNYESKLRPENRTFFGAYCPSWVRLRGEMRHRGMQGVLSEIIILEQELLCDKVERELLIGWNDGDIKKIDLCRKTLDGIINKTRVSMAKSDSDYKKVLDRVDRSEATKLAKFTTDELKILLDATKDADADSKQD